MLLSGWPAKSGKRKRMPELLPPMAADCACAPIMGAILEVKVLPRADHSERSNTQLRKDDRAWGGSVERSREPMYKNQIRGVANQDERALRMLEQWLRRRLRALQLRHWRTGPATYRGLRRLGATQELALKVAAAAGRWWRCSLSDVHHVLNVAH